MSLYNIPGKLQHRIKSYYDYLWLNNLHGTNPLLDDPDLSVPLKKDISLFLYREIVTNVRAPLKDSIVCPELYGPFFQSL